jgi:hypothetical protein
MGLGPKSCANGYQGAVAPGCLRLTSNYTGRMCGDHLYGHKHCIMLAHTYNYWQGCRSADTALKTAHPPHNASQSEAWLQQQELNSSRVFCSIFCL